ncbi:MAG: leucine-rich repeat domain-containing protein, partial [Oscillospiraceae bacterium]
MKKRLLSILMALVLCLSLLPTVALAADPVASGTCGAEGYILTWTLTGEENDYTLTISGTGPMADYTFGTAPWNGYREQITSVVVNKDVTGIGNGAFYYCSALASVTLPERLESIGNGAFYGCSNLESVTIPDKVTSIGNYAFHTCSALASVTLPKNLESIGS